MEIAVHASSWVLKKGREMLMSVSRWALLLALVLALQAVGGALAQPQADATNLYPGRYVAVCKPAPIIGCLCSSYSQDQMSVFPELTSTADHDSKDVRDSEYLQMVTWLRRTCTSLTGRANVE
jgi:hypothetical protein